MVSLRDCLRDDVILCDNCVFVCRARSKRYLSAGGSNNSEGATSFPLQISICCLSKIFEHTNILG